MDSVASQKREEIIRIAEGHGASEVRLFGSMARGDSNSKSDVDLLVKVTGKTSPWFPGGMIADLEDLLGRPVDVTTEQELHSVIRDEVLREAVAL